MADSVATRALYLAVVNRMIVSQTTPTNPRERAVLGDVRPSTLRVNAAHGKNGESVRNNIGRDRPVYGQKSNILLPLLHIVPGVRAGTRCPENGM